MDQSSQLQSYIQSGRSHGLSEETIRNELLKSGWAAETVDASLRAVPSPSRPGNPRRVIIGIIWILSPVILLVAVAILQIVLHYMLNTATSRTPTITIINIFSVVVGIVAIILIPVGPIIGIIKLSRS